MSALLLQDLRGGLPWNPDGERWETRGLEEITHFVVHHSATGENKDPLRTVQAFNRGHIRRNGWPRLAYHYVISSDGTVFWTNRNRDICTHAGNREVNGHSLGVCLIGKLHIDYPTRAQLDALKALRLAISRNRGRNLPALAHYQVVDTTCPGRYWWEREKAWVNSEAGTMRVGVHLPNDGVIAERRWEQINRFRLFKALVRLDGGAEVDWATLRARLDGRSRFILRLYWPGYMEAGELVRRADECLWDVVAMLGAENCLIEIGNEPNHVTGKEGWGKTAQDARGFGLWYESVLMGLRGRGYRNLGFPGLAVAEFAHGERTWGRILLDLMEASDWVGCHCYWQIPVQMRDPAFALNWAWYVDRVSVPVYVTEAGNSACDTPSLPQLDAEQQARQYVNWCEEARAGGVAGVTFFMLDGSEDWKGFRLYDGTLDALVEV